MKTNDQNIDSDLLDDAFSIGPKSLGVSKDKKLTNSKIIDSDAEDDNLIQAMIQRENISQKLKQQLNSFSRKRAPEQGNEPKIDQKATLEASLKKRSNTFFGQLPQQIKFYLTQIYQFSGSKLFVTGVMQNGQTISILANQTFRELYYSLKKEEENSEQLSENFLQKAKNEIDNRLEKANIKADVAEFQNRKYVFEIDGVCRSERPYYKVRYSFDNNNVPSPDQEGEYFKYIFGVTYTPLELFVLNTKIKGPCWVKVDKNILRQTKQSKDHVEGGLCVQIEFVEGIEVMKDYMKPPFLRVMSISLKAAVPSQIIKKQLFPNSNRLDQNHIYCISYTYCEEYEIQLKPPKYNQIQRTYHLKSFGSLNQKNFEAFDTQISMISKFKADLNRLDPDVIVCHDSSKIIDTLIQRMNQLGDKNIKPKLGRLVHYSYGGTSSNQHQRLSASLAGRLLVDTFIHSKDMIKSVDYELQNMAKQIKPEKNFAGMTEEEVKRFLDAGKTLFVLKKIRDEADVAFALMNHLQVLQLTRNLSNICGNLWRRSLQNQRAERNELLIMHECVRKNQIIPDKFKNFKNEEEADEGDKKKYTGGMVIEPKKGMYNDFIILLDFNSLYPSIIRQYNVCFSKLERPRLPLSKFYKTKSIKKQTKQQELIKGEKKDYKKQKNEDYQEFINPPPKDQCTKQNWGFLPRLIDGIVTQRQKCKKAMKTASAQKCIILDIQQKSYKIVANSIYGCLGFSISRFYSKPMAALITRMGREALQRANDIVSARGGVEVIYGDTDSLMIQPTSLNKETDIEKIFEIKSIADDLKKSINKEYTNLQIDIDGIFKPILLLMKKKYVANKLTNFQKIIAGIDNQTKFQLQFKGIEVVRRDGCQATRTSLKKILQILMNSKKDDIEQIYQEIYEYAKQYNKQLPDLKPNDFVLTKQLNKKPKQYTNGESIPHVKVAMDRIKNGEKQQTLINHPIHYLVCKPKLQSQDSLAKRCFDIQAYLRINNFSENLADKLQIDLDYYKQQILHPWMRIFTNLESFNQEKLFQAFDVKDADRKKIKKIINNQKDYSDQGLQNFLTNDMKEKSKKFNEQISAIVCSNCQNTLQFAFDGQLQTRCRYCPVDNTKIMASTLLNKITMWIKQKSNANYINKHKCECQKVYPLTLISKCCRVQVERKSTIPFQIHTFVYLTKELIEFSMSKMKLKTNPSFNNEAMKNQNQQELNTDAIEKLKSCASQLDKYLQNSDYENIKGIFDMFKT